MIGNVSNRTFTFMMIGLIAAIFGTTFVVIRAPDWFGDEERRVAEEDADFNPQNQSRLTGEKSPGEGYVKVGGVWRKEDEVGLPNEMPKDIRTSGLGKRIGNSPVVDVESNSATEAIGEALERDHDPSQVTSFLAPAPFDRDKYETDPESYLAIAPPGRVWQAAQPSDGVTPIQRVSTGYQNVVQGDTVTLKAKAEPGMPVTFYTPHLGEFPNRLKSITIAANEKGIAETQFTATTGTYGDVGILASSPVHSGQARFLVNVGLPSTPVQLVD